MDEVEVRSLTVYEFLAEVMWDGRTGTCPSGPREPRTNTIRSGSRQPLEYATREESTYLRFLNRLLDDESDARRRRSEETRLKLSCLPPRKTLAEFDFSFQPGLDDRQIRELATLSFIHRQENVILLGPPGFGKSHLAIGLACEAIEQGLSVYFISMDRLLNDLRKADREGRTTVENLPVAKVTANRRDRIRSAGPGFRKPLLPVNLLPL